REYGAPEAWRTIGRDLEAIAPGTRVGKIAARTIAAVLLEVIRRRENDKTFRPCESLEGDAALLAHRRASAIGTDQIAAGVARKAVGSLHIDADRVPGLCNIDDLVPETYLDVAKLAHPLQQELGGLELFALHHKRMARVVFEHHVIEYGNQRCARPVPELED